MENGLASEKRPGRDNSGTPPFVPGYDICGVGMIAKLRKYTGD
jgi:hypothetical protein